jgi:hypothetical protein
MGEPDAASHLNRARRRVGRARVVELAVTGALAGVILWAIGPGARQRRDARLTLPAPLDETPEHRLLTVDPRDGIDAHEAAIIAAVYFRHHGPELGWPEPPIRVGNEWLSPARIGPRGRPTLEPIHVDATTGAIHWTPDRTTMTLDALKAETARFDRVSRSRP